MRVKLVFLVCGSLAGCGTFTGGGHEFDAIYNTSSAILNKDAMEARCTQREPSLREACRSRKRQQVNALNKSIDKHQNKTNVP